MILMKLLLVFNWSVENDKYTKTEISFRWHWTHWSRWWMSEWVRKTDGEIFKIKLNFGKELKKIF